MPGPILLNARVTARARMSGVERVAGEIIGRLAQLRPDRYVVARPPKRLRDRTAAQLWEQLVLPAQAARLRAALVYSPANLAPLAWGANVVVMHDASVWRHPESFSRAYSIWHQRLEALTARRARRVVTVSEFSKRELVEILDLDPAAVSVVPNGVADRFLAGGDPEPVRHRHGLHGPYVLTVATADERKNLSLLGGLAAELAGEGIETVWAGSRRSYLPGGGAADGVRSLGYVPDSELPGLDAGARAFVLPSRYEGFGLTCLEAMACGTPVVAADRAALPETCGDAALLVDPDDARAFNDAVRRAASEEPLRARLREAGLRRAAQFTWERAARATDGLLLAEAAAGAQA
jgi:glycosyltransferase involved in cell wall biosynthesis